MAIGNKNKHGFLPNQKLTFIAKKMNYRCTILLIFAIGLNSCNHKEKSNSVVNKQKGSKIIDKNSITEIEMAFRDTIAIDYLKNKMLLNILKLLPETTMDSWRWPKKDRIKTVESIKRNNYLIDSTEMYNNIKYIKPNTLGIQVVDGFWTLSIYEFNENHSFIVTNNIVGDRNNIQTFNFINNKITPLKMINWFGGFEYKLLINNTTDCIELLEKNQVSYNYNFSDKDIVEISGALNKEESENCFKGNTIKYKLNKKDRTFDIVDVYWKSDENLSFKDVINNTKTKTAPLTEATNFDSFIEEGDYNKVEEQTLKLIEIYPDFYKEGYNYKAIASYKVNNSSDFYTVVITILKGDNEMESVLINYDLNGGIIDFKVISYDEIAESVESKYSRIKNNIITIIDELSLEEIVVDTTKFHINKNGEINQIKTKFSSNLKPEKLILLNHIYTDTIEFSTYNDDGDYSLLFGKKNGIDISLIYNWEWNNNEKYNFKYGDIIKVKWKMDSIWLAGDGETLVFRETGFDAERVISNNKRVKFLWRADKFDEELNQNFNSIFINEPFSNSISNHEKAALGYVATFIGNECWWDGKVNENRSNLKCKILTVLNLGYQCSDEHLGFLRSWFSKDSVSLKKLKVCRTMPYTATIQTTFDEITVFTDTENKTISVNYRAHGVNSRESRKWSWTQTDSFKYDLENITLVNSEKTELTNESFE